MKKIELFTDGACSGNPGPGGFGAILRFGDSEKELSGGFRNTTNNRMELMGVIASLESLKEPCEVTVTTDSQYVVNAIEKKWLKGWVAKGWRKSGGGTVLNIDLWKRMLTQLSIHKVSFKWVRGHVGHEENERCDALAVAASQRRDLPEDVRG